MIVAILIIAVFLLFRDIVVDSAKMKYFMMALAEKDEKLFFYLLDRQNEVTHISMFFDLRKWTFNQFYPWLKDEK